jgi:hypothetical protein
MIDARTYKKNKKRADQSSKNLNQTEGKSLFFLFIFILLFR